MDIVLQPSEAKTTEVNVAFCSSHEEVASKFAESLAACPQLGLGENAILNRADALARFALKYFRGSVSLTSPCFEIGPKIDSIRKETSLTTGEIFDLFSGDHLFNLPALTITERIRNSAQLVFNFRNLLLPQPQARDVKTPLQAFRALKLYHRRRLLVHAPANIDVLQSYLIHVRNGDIKHQPYNNPSGVIQTFIIDIPLEELEKRLSVYTSLIADKRALNHDKEHRAAAAARLMARRGQPTTTQPE